jgi:hypothetical protein
VDNHAHIHNPQVVNVDKLHSQPNHNLQVVNNTDNTDISLITSKQVVKEVNSNNLLNKQLVTVRLEVLHNQEVEELVAGGLTVEQIADSLDTLLPLYRAEGIEPTASVLMVGIRQLRTDAR